MSVMSYASPSRQGVGSCIYAPPKISQEVASRPVSREFSVDEPLYHPGLGHVTASSQECGHGQQHHTRSPSPTSGQIIFNGSARQSSPTMSRTPPKPARTPQVTPRSMVINAGCLPSTNSSLQQITSTKEQSPRIRRRVTGGLTPQTPHLTPRTGLGQSPQNNVVRMTSGGQSPRHSGSWMPTTGQRREDAIRLQNGSDGVSPRAHISTPLSTLVHGGQPPQGCSTMNANLVTCQNVEPTTVVAFQEQSGPDASQQKTPRQTPSTPVTTPRRAAYPTCSVMPTSRHACKPDGTEGVSRSFTPCASHREQLLHHTGSWMPPKMQAMQPSQMTTASNGKSRKEAANTWTSLSAARRLQPTMPGPSSVFPGAGPMTAVPPPMLHCSSTNFQRSQMAPPHAQPWVIPQVAAPNALNYTFMFTSGREGSPRSPKFGNGGTAQTTKNLAVIPLEDRLSFPDASCENLSMIMKDPDHDRIKAMQLATEQATLREEHAQARRR